MIHHSAIVAAHAYRIEPADRVRRFVPLVHKLAWHLASSADGVLEVDDLSQIGMIALIEASARHDRPGEDGFAAYAKTRVRGAMIDAIRAARKGSRSRRALVRRLDETEQAMRQETGAAPCQRAVAERLGIDVAQIARLQGGDEARFSPLDDLHESDPAFADQAPDAFEQIIEAQDSTALAGAIAQLPQRLQLVIQLYFVEELNLAEIAAVLDVSTPRVHQLKASALAKLRDALV